MNKKEMLDFLKELIVESGNNKQVERVLNLQIISDYISRR